MTSELWVGVGIGAAAMFGLGTVVRIIRASIKATREHNEEHADLRRQNKEGARYGGDLGARLRRVENLRSVQDRRNEAVETRLTNLEHPPYENADCEHNKWERTETGHEMCVECGLTRETPKKSSVADSMRRAAQAALKKAPRKGGKR